MEDTKYCRKCGQYKYMAEFTNNTKSKDGKQTYCKQCFDEYRKVHYKENTELYAAKDARHYKKNSEKLRQERKIRYVKYKQERPEVLRDQRNNWAKENKGLLNSRNAKRRAHKKQATPTWADQDKIKEAYLQAQILTESTGITHTVDHIVPLQSNYVCGLHVDYNLQIIPMTENSSKGNRHWPDMPDEFLEYAEAA